MQRMNIPNNQPSSESVSLSPLQPTTTNQSKVATATSSVDMSNKPISITIDIEGKTDSGKHQDDLEFRFLCVNLRTMPGYLQFLLCCGGVFFFYLIYGYFQELIFRVEGFKSFGWYLTLVQFAFYTVFGLVELRTTDNTPRKIPIKTYLLLALLTVATMGLSNSSLGYLNYPTQVIFKCCKLIPVLIGGILIQGKKFDVVDVIACLCMSAGITWFTLADSSVSPSFHIYGVFLISLALCADAVIGNVQEKVMKQYRSSNSEMVLYSYSIGFIYILVGQIVSLQLGPAFSFCADNPVMYVYAFVFSLTGYFGVNIVLNLVKIYGALIAVTVTTCRKAVTIILSFLLFSKPFTSHYVWSGIIIVLGIYLNIYSKNKAQWNAKLAVWWSTVWPQKHRLIAMQNLQHII